MIYQDIPMWDSYNFCGHPTMATGGYSIIGNTFFPMILLLFPILRLIVLFIVKKSEWDWLKCWNLYWRWGLIINVGMIILGMIFIIFPRNNFTFIFELNIFGGGILWFILDYLMIIAMEDKKTKKGLIYD